MQCSAKQKRIVRRSWRMSGCLLVLILAPACSKRTADPVRGTGSEQPRDLPKGMLDGGGSPPNQKLPFDTRYFPEGFTEVVHKNFEQFRASRYVQLIEKNPQLETGLITSLRHVYSSGDGSLGQPVGLFRSVVESRGPGFSVHVFQSIDELSAQRILDRFSVEERNKFRKVKVDSYVMYVSPAQSFAIPEPKVLLHADSKTLQRVLERGGKPIAFPGVLEIPMRHARFDICYTKVTANEVREFHYEHGMQQTLKNFFPDAGRAEQARMATRKLADTARGAPLKIEAGGSGNLAITIYRYTP